MDRIPPPPAPPKYPTLLSMALANATPEQRLAIIDQIDWRCSTWAVPTSSLG